MTIAVSILCLLSAAPIAFLDNFPLFLALLWLLLFFGGFILPCLTGIMLSTVDKHYKTIGNSFANLVYNLVGYLPAPSVYGAIYDAGEGGNARAAMATLMSTSVLCFLFLVIGSFFIIRDDVLDYKRQDAEAAMVGDELRYLELGREISESNAKADEQKSVPA